MILCNAAPAGGFEPPTKGLTVLCATVALRRNGLVGPSIVSARPGAVPLLSWLSRSSHMHWARSILSTVVTSPTFGGRNLPRFQRSSDDRRGVHLASLLWGGVRPSWRLALHR